MSYDYAYTKRWRLDNHRGIRRYTDATPAREHILTLLATGASKRAIANAAHVSPTAITQLTTNGQQRIQRPTAARILAVRTEHTHTRPTPDGFVPAIGTRRRIQAMQTIGHSARDIGAAAGVTQSVVHNIISQAGDWISARNRDAILTAYNALWQTRGASRKTATLAAGKQWVPPLAWDDDTIDDPAATPNTGTTTSSRRGLASDDLVEDVEWLLQGDRTLTAQQVATRLNLTRSGIQHALKRANRADLLAHLARNADLDRPGRANQKESTAA